MSTPPPFSQPNEYLPAVKSVNHVLFGLSFSQSTVINRVVYFCCAAAPRRLLLKVALMLLLPPPSHTAALLSFLVLTGHLCL